MNSTIITTVVLLFTLQFFYAQEEEHESFFTETEWNSEFFEFPINFAREIPLQGIEEAIFPPGWGKPESPEFWSYMFVWNVKAQAPLTTDNFEEYLQIYFDGLMDIQNLQNGKTILPTNALFVTTEEEEKTSHYTGKIRLYEGRYTKKMMILNVLATQHYCNEQQKTVVIFRFSPAKFGKPIWDTMNSVKLFETKCGL